MNIKKIVVVTISVMIGSSVIAYGATEALESKFARLENEHEKVRNELTKIDDQITILERQKDAKNIDLCNIERILAKEKLALYYAERRELTETENLENLKEKTEMVCGQDEQPKSEPIQGNFTAIQSGGLDEFLRVNGAEFVKEAGDAFRTIGAIHNIKPEVLVCIAQADSSLGKHLKTKNNIGNVHNTDSGRTKHYESLEKGINAIAQEALNGTYLKQYNKIGELSNGGRTVLGLPACGGSNKCYASSSYNWNRNVVNCLRNITGDSSIDENFNFRN